MTEKQFKKQILKVLSVNSALSGELEKLGIMASEILGANYIADLCEGAEIEFHPVGEDDIADDGLGSDNHTTIFEEDVIAIIRTNNGHRIKKEA